MSEAARQGRDLLGMPVVTIDEGIRLGDVRSLHVHRDQRAVAALGIGDGSSGSRFIPFSLLKTVGRDVLLVQTEAETQNAIPKADLDALDAGLPGRPVITQSGHKLGEISGFFVAPATGRIERYLFRPEGNMLERLSRMVTGGEAEVDDSHVVSLGPDALVVQNEAAAVLEQPHPSGRVTRI